MVEIDCKTDGYEHGPITLQVNNRYYSAQLSVYILDSSLPSSLPSPNSVWLLHDESHEMYSRLQTKSIQCRLAIGLVHSEQDTSDFFSDLDDHFFLSDNEGENWKSLWDSVQCYTHWNTLQRKPPVSYENENQPVSADDRVPVGNPLILAQLADKDDHTEDSLENDSKLEDSDNFLDLLEQIRQVREQGEEMSFEDRHVMAEKLALQVARELFNLSEE